MFCRLHTILKNTVCGDLHMRRRADWEQSTVLIIAVQNISFNDSPLHLESSSFPDHLQNSDVEISFVSSKTIILHRSWILPSTNEQYFDCCLCILSEHVPAGVAPTMFVSKTCVMCSNSRSCDFGYFKTCRHLMLNETGETRLQITNKISDGAQSIILYL